MLQTKPSKVVAETTTELSPTAKTFKLLEKLNLPYLFSIKIFKKRAAVQISVRDARGRLLSTIDVQKSHKMIVECDFSF